MSIEEALQRFKSLAQDFIAMGDVNEYIKNNRDEFLDKFEDIADLYDYIITHTTYMSNEFDEAIDIMIDISDKNPSLENWVNMIINPKSNESEQTKSEVDVSSLVKQIDDLVFSFANQKLFTEEQMANVENNLSQYSELLEIYRSSLSNDEYERLQQNINITLNKINRIRGLGDNISRI